MVEDLSINHLTLSLISQFWALPIQQQIIWTRCQKYGQIGIQLFN